MTPLLCPEYIHIKLSDLPNETIAEYKLHEKATCHDIFFVAITHEMYGLSQGGLLANKLLNKLLHQHGYF